MNNMKLDFSDCNYIMEVYEYVKKQFKLPDYCGNNLDALWDFLRDECPLDAKIDIDGIKYLNNKFDGHGDEIKKIFEDLPKEYGNEKIKIVINS